MSTSEHLSIGEVLNELRDAYPDITLSKIRFLESQGLIDPERTPSGYRKFYPDDVTRLRWILRQQREHFLPLKVIRERLDESRGSIPDDGSARPTRSSSKRKAAPAKKAGARAKKGKAKSKRPAAADPVPAPGGADMPTLPLDDGADEPVQPKSRKGDGLTRKELARAASVDDRQLAELESYGLLAPVIEGERALFDEDALAVARAAAAFAKHGIEARHLKMYKNFAEREAGMFAQVLLPHLRQRNPEARERAQAELEELASLGRSMRAAMLRRAVPRSLSG